MNWFHKITKTVPEGLWKAADRRVDELQNLLRSSADAHYEELKRLKARLPDPKAYADSQEEIAALLSELAEEKRHRGKLERRISQCKSSLTSINSKTSILLNTLKDV